MFQWSSWRAMLSVIAVLGILYTAPVVAETPESTTVAQARELVDTYYGNLTNLKNAAELLERAHRANPNDAHVYVQAARVAVMGGYINFDNYETGTFERYAALLDKALALDPSNAKAHILKAEVFYRAGNHAAELAELNKAKALGTNDPWLHVGFGRYERAMKNAAGAYVAYLEVEKRGPGTTASDRKAYVTSLVQQRGIQVGNEDELEQTRRLAALASKERYPTDAWTPHGYAEDFVSFRKYDEAILYAREALSRWTSGLVE